MVILYFSYQASERELIWVIRFAIFGVGALATVMALKVQSIYALWYLCSDLVYAILFPQLCCVIYVPGANTYGAMMGYITAVVLRVGGGESVIGLEPFIKYPYFNAIDGQLFPFRTFAMGCSFISIVFTSYFTKYLFSSNILPRKCDIFNCFHEEVVIEFEMNKREPVAKDTSAMI